MKPATDRCCSAKGGRGEATWRMSCEEVAFCLEEIYKELTGCKGAKVGLEDGMHGVVVSCKVVAVCLSVGTDERAIGCEGIVVCVEEDTDDEVMGWVFLRTRL